MKKKIKILFPVFLFMFLASFSVAFGAADWDVRGEYVLEFTCTSGCGGIYPHTMNITIEDMDAATFSGSGHYNVNPAYTWNVTGTLTGDNIAFHILYTGLNAGYYLDATGTIAGDGSMSGTASNASQAFTWVTTSGNAVPADSDEDGVIDSEDFCTGTNEDTPWDVNWGTNRWEVREYGDVLGWYQNVASGKKGTTIATYKKDMSYTYGCNGHQILTLLREKLGDIMNGHWKYGLSSSVVEDFHLDLSDGILDGRYLIETVTVPAKQSTDIPSIYPMLSGENYILKARGTADAGDKIEFDARYSFRTGTSTEWTDSVSTYELPYGPTLLDLFFNGTTPWGAYNSSHVYEYATIGDGNPAQFRIYDVYPSNNKGNLYVDIYIDLD